MGMISLIMWMSVLYFLSYIEGDIGRIAMFTYAAYIASIMVFHVICSFIFLLAKHTNISKKELTNTFNFYMIMCIVTSLAYTSVMIYLGLNGILNMSVIHYLTLPFLSTIIFQFGLGRLIKIKHFDSVVGTLSMLISMLSIIHIMVVNFDIFVK